jgi:VWFA-related protein
MINRLRSHFAYHFISLVLLGCLFTAAALAQQPARPVQRPAPPDPQETFRISTVLVQTDVSVFDKQGNFVDGLPREAFELKVDGKPLPVTLFQRVTAGSAEEEANLVAARGKWKPGTITAANPLAQGQSVIFFVDDYHLDGEHIQRAQQIIYSYLERNLRAGDRMMIASSSGQLGFLQQFSDNADILRMTAARLKYQPAAQADVMRPRMSLYEAIAASRNQPDIMEYLVQQYRAQSLNPVGPNLRQEIRMRANNIIAFNRTLTTAMFSTLEALLRGTTEVPGRKLLFFISAGFIIDPILDQTLPSKLDRLIDWAARSGVVFYTVNARGLVSTLPDISDRISVASEPTSDTTPADAMQIASGETSLTQQALRTLAYDTGGQPILNTNGLEAKVSQAIREYQNYYVLAWEPEVFEKDKPKFRKLEVTVKGRPELQVRVRRGFFEAPPPPDSALKRKTRRTRRLNPPPRLTR